MNARKAFKRMTRAGLPVLLLLAVAAFSGEGPRGTVPRASAEKYPAHFEQEGTAIGARLVKPSQAKKEFSTDIDHCCVAVEVAIYPRKDGMIEVSLNDFDLREKGKDIATKPSTPEVIAARLQPPPKSDQPDLDRNVTIYPTAGVGYETGGVDPITGQRRGGGVVTSEGVGVGIGGQRPPEPEASRADRRTMALELHEKGLPEGNTMSPVSGYLYFSVPQKKKAKYQLEYMLNGTKVVLPL
ncbi:MAG TPA: hypothetical protein VFP59_16405 [Candidatus Angelobacter sp.]|nr:hypothetical protein [Candidatus Angelobacter sp.]